GVARGESGDLPDVVVHRTEVAGDELIRVFRIGRVALVDLPELLQVGFPEGGAADANDMADNASLLEKAVSVSSMMKPQSFCWRRKNMKRPDCKA
ncbi:MAG: hypothetical protein IKG69_06310, partial [Atopobiaceae bacterium]|nr:hypothetical protein [Atopobiaceae bacterium]